MLTPPHHFSIVACPAVSQVQDDLNAPAQILYRGSIPATRNLPFLKRLGLKTVVYCKKKELKSDDVLVRWSRKREIDLKWCKAEEMGEEKLGVGKNEISDVLKVGSQCCRKVHVDEIDHIEPSFLSTLHRRFRWYIAYDINYRLSTSTTRVASRFHHQRDLPLRVRIRRPAPPGIHKCLPHSIF
jgi:hypothetical protein